MSKTGVAVLGLGMMGGGMAGRLLSQGFAVTVFNRNPDRARALVDRGAVFAKSPQEAAMRSEIIISMVSDDAASRQVWLGERGALADAKSGALLIESSTLTVGWIEELATAAVARGCEFLDAPVTGSKTQAASGELNFIVGGVAAALENARPVLAAMSKAIVHLGPTGSGALRSVANASGEWSAGRHPIEWNGEGTRGRVPPGLYLIRYRYPGGEASRRIVIAR